MPLGIPNGGRWLINTQQRFFEGTKCTKRSVPDRVVGLHLDRSDRRLPRRQRHHKPLDQQLAPHVDYALLRAV